MTLYECEMMFTATIGLKEINHVLTQFGCDYTLQVKDAVTFNVTQTLMEIPDKEYLQRVADILKEGYETEKCNVIECHFSGYKNIRVINLKEAEKDAE